MVGMIKELKINQIILAGIYFKYTSSLSIRYINMDFYEELCKIKEKTVTL